MTDYERTRTESRAIRRAASGLGLQVTSIEAVAHGRTGVYRVHVVPVALGQDRLHGASEADAAGAYAARVTTRSDSVTPTALAHTVVHALHQAGAPVARPLHPVSTHTPGGEVSFWEWLTETRITAEQWGQLTAAFHVFGQRRPIQVRAYDPGWVFAPRMRRARQLLHQPGHPLHGAHRLLDAFEQALDVAVVEAAAAAARAPRILVLGDNQPGNVMRAGADLVLNDFERIATGPPALDLAAVALGIVHYGYPPSTERRFREGYGPDAPSLDEARPFARIRELSGAIVAMLTAGASPQMEREMHVRAHAVTHPSEGPPWTYVGARDAITLAPELPDPLSLAGTPAAAVAQPTTARRASTQETQEGTTT